jgi:protocatechuate 3,4-dioxygenase beta subunit
MNQHDALILTRRHLLKGLAFGAAMSLVPGAFAGELALTPRLTEGPFYPDRLPLDKDNDLIIVGDSITPAIGEITNLSGRILSPSGEPVRDALVEIWQVDGNGVYLHSHSANRDHADANFQGYGGFVTDAKGRYLFRTIKPVPYPGRPAPHIHFAISRGGQRILTTQMLVKGHPGNEQDGVFRDLRDPQARERLLVDFTPIPDSRLHELAASFNIVVGNTPEVPDEHPHGPPGSDGPGRRRRRPA